MKGLCPPANQGNTQDGLWLEMKEVRRLRNIAGTFDFQIKRARLQGALMGALLGFLLTAFLHSGTVRAEERYVEAWVEEEGTEPVIDEYETCFSPYAAEFVPEFWIENMSVTMFWYDTWEEFAADTGITDPDDRALSYCETKPDKNFAYCDVYMVKPKHVDDEAALSGGHEYFHGLFGAYHE